MKKIIIGLSVLLAVCWSAGIFLHLRGTRTAEAFAEAEETGLGEFNGNEHAENDVIDADDIDYMPDTALPPQTSEAPLIPIHWSAGLFYDPARARLYIDGGLTLDISRNYFYDEYGITFENLTWEAATLLVNDEYVCDIGLDGSQLTLRCLRPCLVEYSQDENGTYLQLIDPKEAYASVVIIDPGHGGIDEGAIINRIRESHINLDIVQRVLALFESDSVLLLPTRTDDTDISKDDRYALANRIGDYLISVHNNVDEKRPATHGTKTYFHTHESDTPITSEELAERVQAALVERLDTRDRGTEQANGYRLLINTVIPAIITEVMFLTNEEEFDRLQDTNCRQDIALALCDAIYALPPARIF